MTSVGEEKTWLRKENVGACSISSAIPSTTPPMAIVYSSRVVRISNMFKTGMTSDLIRLVLLIFLGPLLIDLLF